LSILSNGNIKVKVPCGIGESTVCMLSSGDLVDLNGIASSTSTNAKFYAVGNTTVLSMHKSKFDGLVNSHPLMMCRVMHGMMLNLQSVLRRMNSQIADLRNYIYGTNSRS
jgi:CRP-like cAMP-binding protein